MTHTAPHCLYRYRGLSGSGLDRVRQMILHSEHFFSSPAKFNDPFDCRPEHRFDGSESEVSQYLQRLLVKFQPEQSAHDREAEIAAILADPSRDPRRPDNLQLFSALIATFATDQTGVLCLSAAPDVPLMWSHYGQSHTGVCLGFDSDSDHFAAAQPVRYTRKRPTVDPTTQTRAQMLDASLFTKSLDWAYEEEWRIVLESGPGKYTMPTRPLRTVVTGTAISPEHFKEVLGWTKSLEEPIELYRATPSANTFDIELQRYL